MTETRKRGRPTLEEQAARRDLHGILTDAGIDSKMVIQNPVLALAGRLEEEAADSLKVVRERTKQVRYAIYRALNLERWDAAHRAGYEKDEAADPKFLDRLDTKCRIQGHFADVELPIRDMIMAEVSPSFATIVHLRDHAMGEKGERIRLEAAKALLALGGYSTSTSTTRYESIDKAEQEFGRLSTGDQARALLEGKLPPLRTTGMEVREEPPRTEEEIERMMDEAEIETGGPLAG